MEFFKKHYEKIALCVVLLGLAGAVLWMKSKMESVNVEVGVSEGGPPRKSPPPTNVDLSAYEQALAQVTNPPTVVLSGDHNLFNPVTWKRLTNGELYKVMKTGTDALGIIDIVPIMTVISYERPMEGPIYVMGIQRNVDTNQATLPKPKLVYPKLDEKNTNQYPFVIRGIKGAAEDPSEINLEMIATGESNIWVSSNKPYQRVDYYLADLRYDPEMLILTKKKTNDVITLDKDPYIILDITSNAIRVQAKRTTKVTEIKWTNAP